MARSSHEETRATVPVAQERLKISPPGLLGLDPSRPEDALPVPWPPRGGLDPSQDPFARPAPSPAPEEVPVPLLALDLEEAAAAGTRGRSRWSFTTDRAVLLSVLLHALFALLVIVAPAPERRALDTDELPPDLLGLNKLWAVPPQNPPIPVHFYPAPGPRTPEPGPRPRPSDVDRKAGGGDPRLPKADTPKSVAGPGIRDLAPGRRGPGRGPGEDARAAAEAARRAAAAAADRGTGGVPRETAADAKGDGERKGLTGLPSRALREITVPEASSPAAGGSPPGGGAPGGGGDEGAGWESEGGFVDSGPLSFDTKGYDWGPYAAEMIRKIKRNWDVPKLAHYGLKGRLVVRFHLQRDGRVEGLRLLVSSGVPPYDNASMQAIRSSSPFRPLPADFPNPREGVTITFLYNVRPEDEEKAPESSEPRRPLLPR